MDPRNAVEIRNVSKSFNVMIGDRDKKSTFFNRVPTKKVQRTIINDLSLDIRKGDVIGILGRNGAGKSTLLSLIAKIMEPDSGTIEYSGKIATILELGMGFHQDMSGRENIYIKGELYGFSRAQIDDRIEQIIDYSGIREYIDNPVRTYSSGMSGRLAFAIMVNVDSDIILVDEILSVGDSSFSYKATEHFKKMASSGRTVILVSHSIGAIESMCTRAVWLEGGKIYRDGPAKKVCAEYQNAMSESPEIVTDLAMAGVPDAQYKLALMYRDGGSSGKSEDLYEQWMKQAAMGGHIRAQVTYADILYNKGDVDEAVSYYSSAASRGDKEARDKITMLSLPKQSDVQKLISMYGKIAVPGDCFNENRYATLLLKNSWSDEDRVKSFEMFVRAAEDGSSEAMNQVGLMYRDGVGTKKDVKKMEEYLHKAGDRGHIPALVLLSDIYLQGRLLPKNDSEAFNCLLKAAKLGDGNSMYKIANMLKDGIGTKVDMDESELWFKRYTNTNYFWHYWGIADYVRSSGLDAPEMSVESIYDCELDRPHPLVIGLKIANNIVNGKNVDSLVGMMRYLADNGNIDAIKRMGNLYYDGVGVKRDYSEAIKWYKKAACLGDNWSKFHLGNIYRDGRGVPVDMGEALKWYDEAAKQGNIGAIGNMIGVFVSCFPDNKKAFVRAITMMKSNASSGNVDAIKRMGNLYYDGVGVKRDYSEAIKWYKKAACLGDNWAKNRLMEMYREGKGTCEDYKNIIQ